jgi:hypothetical protein
MNDNPVVEIEGFAGQWYYLTQGMIEEAQGFPRFQEFDVLPEHWRNAVNNPGRFMFLPKLEPVENSEDRNEIVAHFALYDPIGNRMFANAGECPVHDNNHIPLKCPVCRRRG